MYLYSSDLIGKCSCVVCQKIFSVKGVFTHYIISHTDEGKNKHRQNSIKVAKYLSENNIHPSILKKQKDEEKYLKNPRLCNNCQIVIKYENKMNIFCSKSCATTFNNKRKKHKTETKNKISSKLKNRKIIKQVIKVKTRKCQRCLCIFEPIDKERTCNSCRTIKECHKTCPICENIITNKRKKYCILCYPTLSYYRTACAFYFNVFDYPEEFDLELLNTYGWYSPNGYKRRNKNPNLGGVSRDHILSVSEGFKRKIDPAIISHPANCRLMIHNGPNGNNSKNENSNITLEELLIRIEKWNSKYLSGVQCKN